VTRVRMKLTKLVVAVRGGARGPTGGAMVAGMAMAISFTVVGACDPTVALTIGTEDLSKAVGGTHLSKGDVIGGGSVRETFTPLLADEPTVGMITYCMFVWGHPATPHEPQGPHRRTET
jgi:hypothetical protein